MISSITVKNLLASDDEDNDANYKDINEEKFFNYSDEFTSRTKRTKMENGYKQEISLPKTRLTQRGQLYLYTDGTEDERDYALNKNLINKAYSKKWIDDISDDFGLDPASIFDQDTPKSMETGNCILNKLGKQTDYFIHELKLKSVKERFMGKANYFEYLPDDYDPRIELVETLKALNINRQTPPNNKTSDTPTDRRRPSNNYSRFSFANDIPECNSSDDEKDYSNEMNNKPESRLSNQPVLSAQSLINKLSCKVLNEESVENGKNEEPPRVSELTINYKDVFNLEDVHTCSSRLESERKSSLTKADTAITAAALAGVAPSLDSIPSPKPTKILFKRADLNASPTCAERSSHNNHSSATPRRTSRVHSSPSFLAAKQTMNKVALSNRNNSPRDAATTPSRIGLLKVTGSSSKHADAELPNLGSMRQANSTPNYPHRHAHHHHNNNFNAPMRPFQSTNEPDTAEDTHLAPITISVTEIEHEPTGNSVRIRKFFDRKALRIKQMNINFKDVDPTRQRSRENRLISNKHQGELVNLNNANNNNPPVDVLSARLNSNDTESSSTRRNINSAPVSQPPLIDEQEINSARPRIESQTSHGIIYSSRIQTPEVQEPQSPKFEPDMNENIQPVNEMDDVKSTPHQEAEEFVSIPRVASLNEILECSNIENNSPQSGNSPRVIITPVSSPRSNEKPQRRASTRQSSRLSSMETGTKTPRRSSTTTSRKPSTDANDHQTLASNSHEQMRYSATQSRKASATELNFNPATSQPHSRRSTPGAKSPQHTVEHTTAEHVEPLLRSEIVDSSQVATPADPVNNPPVVDSSRRSSFSLSRESFNFDPDEIVDKNETDDETLVANDDVDQNPPQTTQQVDHIIPTIEQFNLDEQLIVTPRHTTSLVSVDQPEQEKKANDPIKSPDVPQDNRSFEDDIINLKTNVHTTPVQQERNVLQHVVSVDVPPTTSELDESKRINVEEVGQEKSSLITSGNSSSEIIRVKKVDFASEEQKDEQHPHHTHSNELVHSHTDLEEATVQSTQSVDEEPKHIKIILKKDENTPGAGASSLKTNHLKSKKNASSNRRKTSLVRHKTDTTTDLKHKSQLKSDSRVSSDTLDSLSKTDIAIDHMNTLVESKDTMKMEEPPPPQKTIPEVAKKERTCRYPYLTIPWYSKEPIVNYEAYYKRFDLPENLCPELLNLDPKDVSIDELIYERRVLEDKILELKQIKLANKDVKTTKDRKFTKKPTNKKPSKQEQKRLKDISSKERVIFEERLRLHEEAKKNKLERDRMLNVFVDKLKEKRNEIDDLNTQLESNTQDFESHNKNIANQLAYLDNTEDEIHDAIGKSRQELHATIEKRQAETRRQQKEMQEERREEKMFEFDVKKKEISWLLDLYTDEEELRKVNSRLIDLELKRTEWLKNFENKVIDEEKELDRREEIEWDKLHQVELEEEETALKDLKREQLELLEEKKKLVDNFENMKQKIHDRIESIKEEIKVIENEKVKFEQDLQANILKQKETLDEILNAEREARESIKNDLEQYRFDLITTREKNIKMRSHLSFLTHMHAINKPYLFSYGVHWPLESFARPFNEDKRKQGNKKKKPGDLDEI